MIVRIYKNSLDMQKIKILLTESTADRAVTLAIAVAACAATWYFATFAIEASLINGVLAA